MRERERVRERERERERGSLEHFICYSSCLTRDGSQALSIFCGEACNTWCRIAFQLLRGGDVFGEDFFNQGWVVSSTSLVRSWIGHRVDGWALYTRDMEDVMQCSSIGWQYCSTAVHSIRNSAMYSWGCLQRGHVVSCVCLKLPCLSAVYMSHTASGLWCCLTSHLFTSCVVTLQMMWEVLMYSMLRCLRVDFLVVSDSIYFFPWWTAFLTASCHTFLLVSDPMICSMFGRLYLAATFVLQLLSCGRSGLLLLSALQLSPGLCHSC